MDATFILGNMVGNAGLIAVVGFGVKRWMDRIDIKLDTITADLKAANGRTGKIETKLETQIAVCVERHKE